MLLTDNVKLKGLKAPAFASLSLAFASFGDAFLYPFLPLNNFSAGVPMIWVGVLLSSNRFVRILSNMLMVRLFGTYGLRVVMLYAALFAIISTAGYAISSGVLLWLFFRILWGLAFSALRLGTLGYALLQSQQGLSFGVSRSLQEAGPMLSLFLAPFLLNLFEMESVFFLLAGLSFPALWFAWKLPDFDDKTHPVPARKLLKFPSAINSITFLTALLIDGVMVVVLGILFLHYRENISLIAATSLAAFYLGFRRICLVALSPASGWMADKFGVEKVFNISIFFVIAGFIFLVSGWIATGSVIVFAFYSIHAAITPGTVSRNQLHSLAAVAENATWRDLGAAIGTLTGGFLITTQPSTIIFIIAIFSLLILALAYLATAQKAVKLLYLWK